MTPSEKFEQFVSENKISLDYKFVPCSLSRNANEKDKTLNWKVTIKSPNGQFTCDYQKGIGHLPYPQTMFFKIPADQARAFKEASEIAAETGVARKVTMTNGALKFGIGNAQFPNPTIREVLESLSLDSDVKNYLSFESWAREFGYDTDSKSAEKTYKACQKAAEGLAKVLGGADKIDVVREMIYDIDNEPQPNKKIKP